MRKVYFLFFLFSSFFSRSVYSQNPASFDAADIFLKIKKLNVLGSVLYIAAHPDDENTRLLAYLAKDRLYRTGYLSMTRGDGGQNLIGDEQGIELGLIRTQELLAARRIDGAEQFFARAYDFGYTKTTKEALNTWNEEKILSDVVWVIRRFQPDILITRFPEDSRAGHGQHSASSVLAHEAFEAAADSTRFPEQFKYGVKPWRANCILWNTFSFGNVNTTSADQLQMDVGGYNAMLGKSYGELAAESRSQHKSQGFGIPRSRGQATEFFKWVEGAHPSGDIMDGISTTWGRLEEGKIIQPLVDSLTRFFNIGHPEYSLPQLIRLYGEIRKVGNIYWRTIKLKEVEDLIIQCSGVWLEATVRSPYAVPGDFLSLNISLISRLSNDVSLHSIAVNGKDTSLSQRLSQNKNYGFSLNLPLPLSQPLSQPYWLKEEMSPGSYNVDDQLLIGEAEGKPALTATFILDFGGTTISVSRPVQYKFSDPVKGEEYQPLCILPSRTAHFEPALILFNSLAIHPLELQWQIHGESMVSSPEMLANESLFKVTATENHKEESISYEIMPKGLWTSNSYFELANLSGNKRDTVKELRTINYDHIPRIDYLTIAKAKLLVTDCKTRGKKLGYVEGAGDKVPQALVQLGYTVQILKERDINPVTLKQFDAIITGVRAYDVHEWLFAKYDILMDYIRNGGNLIVQYNRNAQIGSGKALMSPFPFSISNNRVTDETAKVRFLLPDHPVLNFPNKITDKDFDGWIQERGIYFGSQPDSHFQAVLSMNDPGEPEQKGSLLIANYGEGTFVYTGLVFFRELPAGVSGAYRLIANIVALNQYRNNK